MALLPSNANGPPVLFIAAGQSNAVGRTATAASESAPEAGVFFDWRSDQLVFNDLADPAYPAEMGSAWPAFGRAFYQLTGRQVIILSVAKGSAAVTDGGSTTTLTWADNAYGTLRATAQTAYNNLLSVLPAQFSFGGLLWCQGETETGRLHAGTVTVQDYKTGTLDVFSWFRTLTGQASLPVFLSKIGFYADSDLRDSCAAIQQAQEDLCDDEPLVHMGFDLAPTFFDLGYMSDDVHYTQEGYNLMGQSLADVAATVLGSYEPPANSDEDFNMPTIISKDSLRTSVEAATGGLVTVLYDDAGYPNYMRILPKIRIQDVYPDLGLSGTHPAFIVDGVEKSELYIGVYPASIVGGLAVSLPGVDLGVSVSFDAARLACSNKGAGWHMMSNVEWALLGALAVKNNFQPHGNTQWGMYHGATHETGVRYDRGTPGDATTSAGRTLVGTGPLSWRHDNSPAGIADLVGNVHEWCLGLRINAGEIQIIPDNNAASATADHSPASTQWRAILQDGTLVAPGTALTLKYDTSSAGGVGAPVLNTSITNAYPGTDVAETSASALFNAVSAASGVTPPALAKLLHLFPATSAPSVGKLFLRNAGERLALRGGYYNPDAGAGLFALNLNYVRTISGGAVGFRPAFYL